MTKNKNNQAIWSTRVKKNTSNLFQKVGSSIDIDKRLYKEDIKGSISHVEMLFKQKIISFKIKNKIIYGLNKIEKEISGKKFEFKKNYEDIHMNIEKRLFQIIGEEAGYIHTARSRNDQVITDLKIWIRLATKDINILLDKVINSSLNLADKNIFSSALSTLRESLIVIKSKESSNKTLSRHYNKQKENVNSSIQKISNEQLTQLETSQKELQIVQLNRIMKAIEEHLNSQGWLPLGTTPFVEQISNLNEEYKQNRMWALLHVETSFSSFKNNNPEYKRVLNNIKMNYKTAFIIACLNLKKKKKF